MLIKTPKFWLKKNIIAFCLLPLSFVYAVLTRVLSATIKPQKSRKPIICVGNITVGGSGKTPSAVAIGKILRSNFGANFCYLSRGYGGAQSDFCQVQVGRSSAKDVGDEALILAEIAPTFIAKNRLSGVKEIEKMSQIQAIILDDGMQNNSLKKDVVILVIDGKIKFGNGFLFPAGPLRQGVESGLKISDLIIVVGEIESDLQEILSGEIAKNKVVKAEICATNLDKFRDQKLMAFCGLAYPEKFYSFLRKQELNLVETVSFADHYFYAKSDLDNLLKKADNISAKLVCTKKDWVKFDEEYRQKIDFLDIEFKFKNEEIIIEKIREILKKSWRC